MIIHDIEQNTDEWKMLKLGKFSASDAQAIANNGKGLETLCFEKVAEILTKKSKEPYENADMLRGKELEEMARNSYELETGIITKRVGFIQISDYVGASPDGLIAETGLLEIKCKNDANFVRYRYDGKIDPAHLWQMQMQLYVSGRDFVEYVVYNPNFEKSTIIVRVERNLESMEKLMQGLETGEALVKKILKSI